MDLFTDAKELCTLHLPWEQLISFHSFQQLLSAEEAAPDKAVRNEVSAEEIAQGTGLPTSGLIACMSSVCITCGLSFHFLMAPQ